MKITILAHIYASIMCGIYYYKLWWWWPLAQMSSLKGQTPLWFGLPVAIFHVSEMAWNLTITLTDAASLWINKASRSWGPTTHLSLSWSNEPLATATTWESRNRPGSRRPEAFGINATPSNIGVQPPGSKQPILWFIRITFFACPHLFCYLFQTLVRCFHCPL